MVTLDWIGVGCDGRMRMFRFYWREVWMTMIYDRDDVMDRCDDDVDDDDDCGQILMDESVEVCRLGCSDFGFF